MKLKRKDSELDEVPDPKRKKKLEFEDHLSPQEEKQVVAKRAPKNRKSSKNLRRTTGIHTQIKLNEVSSLTQVIKEIDFPTEWLVTNRDNGHFISPGNSQNAGGRMEPTTGSK